MIEFSGKGILLDIEGTTSSVSFVYDVMFPFARRHLSDYVTAHWGEVALADALEYLAQDTGASDFAFWTADLSVEEQQQKVIAEALHQMDHDAKATGLKQLQGLIWRQGFESGEMQAHVFDDVPGAMRRWRDAGMDLRIYSSGSIGAQKLFFGHTIAGNLLELLSGHYDTTIGGKKEAASYQAILADIGQAPDQWLFISDVPAELDAARSAGLSIALSMRPGNADVPNSDSYPSITSFDQIQIQDQSHDESRR